MADNISTPSGIGGLIRYDDEYKSKFQIAPEQVIIIIAVVVAIITLIKIFA